MKINSALTELVKKSFAGVVIAGLLNGGCAQIDTSPSASTVSGRSTATVTAFNVNGQPMAAVVTQHAGFVCPTGIQPTENVQQGAKRIMAGVTGSPNQITINGQAGTDTSALHTNKVTVGEQLGLMAADQIAACLDKLNDASLILELVSKLSQETDPTAQRIICFLLLRKAGVTDKFEYMNQACSLPPALNPL